MMMMDDDDFIEDDNANNNDFLLSQGNHSKGLEIQRNVCSVGHDNTTLTRLNCVHYTR